MDRARRPAHRADLADVVGPDEVARRVLTPLRSLGLDPDRTAQLIISPACGLAGAERAGRGRRPCGPCAPPPRSSPNSWPPEQRAAVGHNERVQIKQLRILATVLLGFAIAQAGLGSGFLNDEARALLIAHATNAFAVLVLTVLAAVFGFNYRRSGGPGWAFFMPLVMVGMVGVQISLGFAGIRGAHVFCGRALSVRGHRVLLLHLASHARWDGEDPTRSRRCRFRAAGGLAPARRAVCRFFPSSDRTSRHAWLSG